MHLVPMQCWLGLIRLFKLKIKPNLRVSYTGRPECQRQYSLLTPLDYRNNSAIYELLNRQQYLARTAKCDQPAFSNLHH